MTVIIKSCKLFIIKRFIRSLRYHTSTNDANDHNNCPFYITTPIFYVNSVPHIGHLYTVVMGDAIHRFHKMLNHSNTIFSVGTDEHGIKIQKAALAHGIDPKTFCDAISDKFKALFEHVNVTNTHFIRTTDEYHKRAVHHFWNTLYDKGYIYKTSYKGWYCTADEAFVPELQLTFNSDNVRVTIDSGMTVDWCEEHNYVFRLSQFSDVILQWLNSGSVVRPSHFQERLILWVRDGLKDISVSRPKERLNWGIEVPNDESQTIYVWFDALVNYLTVAGYPNKLIKWPPDYQIIGKDILRFHGLFWPAFLAAADLKPPKTIICHSHWLVDDVKMSKSRGNVIDPFDRIRLYTSEGMRYFLLREGVPHSDGNYTDEKVIRYLNNELADTLGNLLSRCTSIALNKNQIFPLGSASKRAFQIETEAIELIKFTKELPQKCKSEYLNGNFYLGIQLIMECLRMANFYFNLRKPWELAKDLEKSNELDSVLYINLEVLRVCAILLQPIVPNLSGIVLDKLNSNRAERNWSDAENAFSNKDINGVNGNYKSLNSGTSKVFQKIK